MSGYALGGLSVRSDAAGTAVPNLGTSGVPKVFGVAYVIQSDPGTDVRDYANINWFVVVTTIGAATLITVKMEWSEDGTSFGAQQTEVIAAGAATEDDYVATKAISGIGTFTFSLPVRGPLVRISILSDAVDLQGYVLSHRQAS